MKCLVFEFGVLFIQENDNNDMKIFGTTAPLHLSKN